MPVLSVKIQETLYQQLAAKAKAMGELKISEVVRLLLQEALEKPDLKDHPKLNQKLLHYSITTYYLVQAHLIQNLKEGATLNESAHQKANQICEALFKKNPK